jgi:peptide/nickel transport system substrate-binding protein
MTTRKTISRRDFIRLTSFATAGLVASACAAAAPQVENTGANTSEQSQPAAPAAAPAVEKSAADAQSKEAPMLAEMVAAGDIPPLEERLPAEPLGGGAV